MKKYFLIAVITIAVIVGGVVWWQLGAKKENVWKSNITMHVPRNNWPGNYWITIADQKGWFKEAGLNVETVNVDSDYMQSLRDTVDGKLDTNSFTLFDLMNFNIKGAGLVVVINADNSSGADALVAKKEIDSVASLKGKTIGVAKGFYTEYVLHVVLEQAGVSLDSVRIVNIQDEKSPDLFLSGSFDAVETFQPYADGIVKNGGHIIWDSSKISGLIPSGIAFKQSFIDAHPNEVEAFVYVWNKTTNYIKSNPNDVFDIIAATYNSTRADIAAFAQTDKILDSRDNKTAFSYAAGFESLHGTARKINDFMIKNKITDKRLETTKFIDAQFIRGLTN